MFALRLWALVRPRASASGRRSAWPGPAPASRSGRRPLPGRRLRAKAPPPPEASRDGMVSHPRRGPGQRIRPQPARCRAQRSQPGLLLGAPGVLSRGRRPALLTSLPWRGLAPSHGTLHSGLNIRWTPCLEATPHFRNELFGAGNGFVPLYWSRKVRAIPLGNLEAAIDGLVGDTPTKLDRTEVRKINLPRLWKGPQ